jgi:hypothetical protein
MLAIRSLGQEQTGITRVDAFLASPTGKIVTAGTIGMATAKIFPGRSVASFALGAILAMMTGLAPDIKMGTP